MKNRMRFAVVIMIIAVIVGAFIAGHELHDETNGIIQYATEHIAKRMANDGAPAELIIEEEATPVADTVIVVEKTEHVVEETEPVIPEPILWDENVNLVPYYHEQDVDLMSYLLYTPTDIQEGQKLPLLIWFHGMGEKNVDVNTFRMRGFPAILEQMELTPNAFILCPQLDGAYDLGSWCNEGAAVSVATLVDYIIATNPAIDVENISVSGHSLGGAGSLYMAEKLPYVKRVASLSPYNPKVTMTMEAENVAIYAGETRHGEDSASVNAANNLAESYGYEINFKPTNHSNLPGAVFEIDAELGYPVVLDWLLSN